MRAAALAIGSTLLLFGCTGAAAADPLRDGEDPLDTIAQQQALLGCGPIWGTECTSDGIDLRGMETSVLWTPFLPDGVPLDPGIPMEFPNETVVYYNDFLMMLLELSGDIDPDDPSSAEIGVCSYAQPMYCPSLLLFFAPEPEAALGALTALGVVGGLGMRRRPQPVGGRSGISRA